MNLLIKRAILVAVLFFLGGSTFAQLRFPEKEDGLVKWMSLEEAMARNKQQPRPILLDFYTSWCGWCKQMLKTTYADSSLAQYINTYFYAAKFNAEGKDTIEYLGKKYGPSSSADRAPHQLTQMFLKDKLMYPTTLFLNSFDTAKQEFAVSMLASGYLDRVKIEPLLIYNVENVFRSASYDDFNAAYQKAFYDSTSEVQRNKLIWLTPQETFAATVPKKRKTLIFIHTEWCNACKVMQRTSFSDSTVMTYLQKNYDLVDMDAQMAEPLKYKQQDFVNLRTPQAPFHQLAVALCRNNLILPTLVILDEEMNFTDAVSLYIAPKFLNDILHFYGDNIYKSKSWQDYMKEKENAATQPQPPKTSKK